MPAAIRIAVGAMLAGALAAPATAAPQRVVSLNLCTDQLVLRLVPAERIASVTWLGKDPRASTAADLARDIPANHGLAEQVLHHRPDLVVAGRYTTRATVAVLRRLGQPLVEFGVPDTLDAVRADVRRLADALGVPEHGEAVIAEMDARFAAAAPPAGARRPRAIVLYPNGFTVGRGSLIDEMITRAGLANAAADLGLKSYDRIPLETAILAGVEVLIVDGEPRTTPALATELLHHRALRRLARRIVVAHVPSRLWTCGGPWLADAVAILARAAGAVRGERAAP